jgi:hypothetical protein
MVYPGTLFHRRQRGIPMHSSEHRSQIRALLLSYGGAGAEEEAPLERTLSTVNESAHEGEVRSHRTATLASDIASALHPSKTLARSVQALQHWPRRLQTHPRARAPRRRGRPTRTPPTTTTRPRLRCSMA